MESWETYFTRHDHGDRLAHASGGVELVESEDLANGCADAAFGHYAEAPLRIAGYELGEVVDPGRLVHHLVVAYVAVALLWPEALAVSWLAVAQPHTRRITHLARQVHHVRVVVVKREDDAAARVYGFACQGGREVVLTPDGVLPVRVSTESGRQEATRGPQEHDLTRLCASVTDALLKARPQ
jgi:hypothetical protein